MKIDSGYTPYLTATAQGQIPKEPALPLQTAAADNAVGTGSAASGGRASSYDFTNISRADLADTGMKLFRSGQITLDELFRFQDPTPRIAIDGTRQPGDPGERIDFTQRIKTDISNMETTGEASMPKSSYSMLTGLLFKLQGLQGKPSGVDINV